MDNTEKKDKLTVNVDVTQQVVGESVQLYLGYKMDYKRDLSLVGLFTDETIGEVMTEQYKDAVIDNLSKESKTVAMFGASFAKVSVDEMLGFKLIFIPLPSGTILTDFKVSSI